VFLWRGSFYIAENEWVIGNPQFHGPKWAF
jgi:hypothetical protein